MIRYALICSLVFMSRLAAAQCNDFLVSDTPSSRYQISEQAWVIDSLTGLMWSRCPYGYQWADGACASLAEQAELIDWVAALAAVDSLSAGGYQDWRLPNRKELESIVDRRCFGPALNEEVFPGDVSGLFWTSSPNVFRADTAWVVDFDDGAHTNLEKTMSAYLRPVRDYQP